MDACTNKLGELSIKNAIYLYGAKRTLEMLSSVAEKTLGICKETSIDDISIKLLRIRVQRT